MYTPIVLGDVQAPILFLNHGASETLVSYENLLASLDEVDSPDDVQITYEDTFIFTTVRTGSADRTEFDRDL